MKKYKLDQLEFQTMEEFLSSFTPPNTYEIYDNVNDRSAVLNKYNFSQEIIHSKDPQKESLINKLDNEIKHYSDDLKELNDTLINVNQDINNLNAPTKIKEINLELEKIIALNNSKQSNEPVDTKFYNKYSPMFSYSMNESNKEYMESLGLKYVVNIPKEHEDLLKKDLESGKINKETYETKYSNLMLAYTKLEVSETYFDNFFKLYFDFIKPAMEVSPLNWLHKSHLFYENVPSLMINDSPKDSRYLNPFNRDLGQTSILEKFSLNNRKSTLNFYKEFGTFDIPKKSELQDIYFNDKDKQTNMSYSFINPTYDTNVLELNKSFLLEVAGIGHIFKDHPIYKDHLAINFEKTFGEKINSVNQQGEFDPEKNKFYLQNGYKKDSQTDVLRTTLNKIDIKGNNLLTIESLDELHRLNFSKEEKTKLFLNLLVGCFKMNSYFKTRTKTGFDAYIKKTETMTNDDGPTNILLNHWVDYDKTYSKDLISKLEKEEPNSIEIKLRKSLSNKIGINVLKGNLFNRSDFLSDVTNEDLYNPNLITIRNYHTQEPSLGGVRLAQGSFFELKNGYTIKGFLLSDKKTNDHRFKVVIVEDKNGNKKKYDFNDIINRFPYVKVLLNVGEEDGGFSLDEIDFEKRKVVNIRMQDFDELWNKNLNIEEDFEIIHNLYMNTIGKLDYDREYDKNLFLDKLWKDFYLPWYDMEQDKIDFWKTISNEIKYKINNESTNEIKEFYNKIEYLLRDVYEKIMSQYSNESKESNYFDFKLNIDDLIYKIINEDKKAITESYELSKFIDEFGVNDQQNYVNNEFLKDTFNNDKLKNFINEQFNKNLDSILDKEGSSYGKHGIMIANKIINFVKEKLNPLNRPKEVNPLSLYSNEVRDLITKMETKYGKGFIDVERPPYFPTVKYVIKHFLLELYENKMNCNLTKYYVNKIKPMIDLKENYDKYIIPEYVSKEIMNSGTYTKYRSLEKEVNDSIFIAKIVNGIEMVRDKGYELNKVIELEKNRSELVEQHNKMAKEFKDKKEERKLLLPKYEETIKKMKELKLENYIVTNNIDREKFMVTMKAIVDMTLNEFNKEKIIDLTKLDDIDNNLKKFEESLTSLNTITKNALISNYILHINSLYEKRGLTDKFNLVEINPVQYEMILENKIDGNIENLIIEEQKDSSNKITKIKAYEGNHFPLFIDLESLNIWSVEWTTRYPTLNIYVMPQKYNGQ